ncbi:MAG: hypothetical protein A3C38_07365 [Planctomycetes bacterium RIFCSPHIGHO2_02_FULL_50_42]|uniref:hypothetical protein n=1 Tax=Candidatus Avalokitesvara rifleensis TaxID=3367620 RepID=UPI0008B54EAB|nr:hypothetical protein [Candidatus Brocadiales bacterium]OHB39131.1 MAG: hypothetical protein A2060_04730 [Planctomycetes bacterium GWA2_50_13]OHB89995.1 MAG: hypothetical protein A3C38_07365 [Planctomycetes bacterium RIFCSPHIGHO2_02_FULL_50_42]OHB92506.1 MAG: hypothetical protein A3E75_05820 [Planctomycetes bacterium RIFCSPHIGHO2_12_FULL_51_37]OHB95758.1 MAG: hypothetical protein A3I59_07060 [Planctomycetes bacterium RIFCSPLOWO2_02_FULL_50_16]OHC02522.1 MAG: hypothetical protein A3G17_03615 
MPVIVGIDEAGYGPTLGPLVITATAFDVAVSPQSDGTAGQGNDIGGPDLWHMLKEAVASPRGRARNDNRIVIGDSKKLYSTQKGLHRLEEGVLSFQMCLDEKISDIRDLLISLNCYDEGLLRVYPWYYNKRLGLPSTANTANITQKYGKLKGILSFNEIKYLAARSTVMSPYEFNKEVARLGNKSLLLFKNCVNLIIDMWRKYPEIEVVCGKHGGRDKYGPMLSGAFRGTKVKTLSEDGKFSSQYEVMDESSGRRMRISFLQSAEDAHLPVALASMYCKYIRELYLKLFNGFWQERLPGLKPTAGYPEDAQRFLKDINGLKTRLGISDEILVRDR